MRVLGGMRRHGAMELLLELPDGSKSLVPAAWTDVEPAGMDGLARSVTLGSLADLLHVCELVADLSSGTCGDRLQGCHRARRTPMQPVQLSLIPDPSRPRSRGR